MRIAGLITAFLVTVATAMPAQASTEVYTGSTTGQPTYHRTLAGSPPSSLSAVGTDVNYQAFNFMVTNNGTYNFGLDSSFDNFLAIYLGSFDPTAPLSNILVADDDSNGLNATISTSLLAGTSYFAIVTGFSNTDSGAFTLTANSREGSTFLASTGDGVPEPATWAMMLLGFGAVGFAMRRQRPSQLLRA